MNPTRSLAFKLTLAFLLVGLIGAALMVFFFVLSTQRRFDEFVGDRMREDSAEVLAQHYQNQGGWEGVGLPEMRRIPGPPPGGRWPAMALLDADGNVIVIRGEVDELNQMLGKKYRRRPIEVDGRVVGWLVSAPNDDPWAPAPESPEGVFLNSMRQAVLFSAIGATLLALFLGILLARTLTRPIRALTTATRALAEGDLEQQVDVRTGDEIGELAAAFNQMSADLSRASQLRRQMTADIAHDLRTPLSLVLGYTESLSDGKLPASPETLEIIHDEARHLSRLVDDLRTLSLAEAGELSLVSHPVQLQTLLQRIRLGHTPEAQERQVSIQVELEPDTPEVFVDAGRMAQVLNNLVNNALRHTPPDGNICLSAEAEMGGDRVLLRVADTGTGIAAEDLPYVFNRFYRSDKSRQGNESGLGLAIAKSMVEIQGGQIWVESESGKGATFTIALPVAKPDQGNDSSTSGP